MKKTKRMLLHSAIAMLLCISMLAGSTYAWFSKYVTSGRNIITSGNLDLEMYWTDDLDSGVWHNVEDDEYNTIFNYDNWEPGYTDVKYIKLVNVGELAFNYKLSIDPQGSVGKLAEVINVYYANDKDGIAVESREDLDKLTSIGLLNEVMSGGATANGVLLADGEISPIHDSGDTIITIAMTMITTAGNEYMGKDAGDFTITAIATQAPYEKDSFGDDYDSGLEFPTVLRPGKATVDVTPVDGKVPAGGVALVDGNIAAVVPEGTLLADGTDKLTLTVTPLEKTTSDITVVNNEVLIPVDVHIDGIADNNTTPIVIDLGVVLPKYLNMGNYHLYHVEDGVNQEMTLVSDKSALVAHNQFTYDPNTGAVSVSMASFSEVTLLVDTAAKWEGGEDNSWYSADKTELYLANADQMYSFAKIVGGMAVDIEQDSFKGKTVKLLSDINFNHGTVVDKGIKTIFYPVGYYNSEGAEHYDDKTGTAISSGFYAFEGTFDGNGHTISNIYQNTWEMKGDHNWYEPSAQHYRDGMGLFGKVYGGTVKNLTVDNFESDGEITTTGVIAAYADCGATFENIAITNCTPRVYNIGNGGIVGCVGWYTAETTTDKVTFKNITVDATNKISALWGSYDVACGGIVGQYYPTSGQTSVGSPKNAGISFVNCHVAAQIDVYNDVCGNYQYYAYRYSGMMIGSIRENLPADENGHVYPNMNGITATGCTVHYDTWNDYFYCELKANSIASYTHDHQFSRLEEVKSVDGTTITPLKGESFTVPANGRYNYVVVNGEFATENATCYHFVDGEVWNHSDAGKETINGVEIDVEDHAHIYLPFNQLFTGYGWGVTSRGIGDYDGIKSTDITHRDETNLIKKFDKNEALSDEFIYRVGNGNEFPIGKLFTSINEELVVDSGVYVSVDSMLEGVTFNAKFKNNSEDWKQSTLHITGGTGLVKLTIQDYNHCEPFELIVEVVDATNITKATAGTDKSFVLLDDVTFGGTYLYYKNSILYGNGFKMDISKADNSDLSDLSDTNSNKSAYCNIWMVNSKFDNVQIIGGIYPEVGMTADSDYGNAAIRTEGDCYITNSYISNCRVPLRIQGNTTITNTVVDGGRYANIELRSGKLTLDGVTTINTVRKAPDADTDVIGFGIVIHSEAANASITVIGNGLKQYNWVGENKHKAILSKDTYLSNAYKLIFNSNNSDSIYFDYENDRFVNTGILCLCADINKDAVSGLDERYYQEVSGYDAWVLTYDNSKHQEWFKQSVSSDSVNSSPSQSPVLPSYSGNEAQTIEFTKGETYYFDSSVLKAEKSGKQLEISSVVMNGSNYNYGDMIPFNEGGIFEIVYTVVDPYNYEIGSTTTVVVNHTVSITVTAIAKDAEILAPKFTFIDQNGNKYGSTIVKAGDKTYVMPDVTEADPTTNSMSSINIGSTSISGTIVYFPIATGKTVRSGSNFNRYYPLFNGINITDYTIAGDTTGTTYTTSGDYTSLVGSAGTKFIIPANGGQTNCGDYVKTSGQSGNAAGNSDSGWQGAGYSTSYGGTYLKSGNTNASSGADSNGYERIVWVEYCFNAGNGDVYYYRIGYHCNKEAAQTGCVTPDTLVTLADGNEVRVDSLKGTEELLVWNHETGMLDKAPVAYIVNHDGVVDEHEIVHLAFANGKIVKIIGEHVFFDTTLNKYVAIDTENANEFIGHSFAILSEDGTTIEKIRLDSVERTVELTSIYEVVSYKHLTCFTEGVLSTSAYLDSLLNVFDINEVTIAYTREAVQKDIETYGLYTYADFEGLISEEAFELYNAQYLKIAVGKGYITWEDIYALIDIYFNVNVEPIY